VKRLILVAFFLEVGFLLIVVPWSAFWERNYFAQNMPVLLDVITNNFVRGAISGLGLVNVCLGIVELVQVLASRHIDRPPSLTTSHITPED
jgi:hypothetical protein